MTLFHFSSIPLACLFLPHRWLVCIGVEDDVLFADIEHAKIYMTYGLLQDYNETEPLAALFELEIVR